MEFKMKQIVKFAVASLVISFGFASTAHAWGEREQGALAGVAGLWIFQQLSKPQVVVQQPPVVYAPPQVVYTQPPVVVYNPVRQWCETRVIIDQNGFHRTAQVCWYQ
jgi:hypothetical protein